MIGKIKNYYKKQSFYPTTIGIFFNPFYIARKRLVQNIEEFACHFQGGRLLDIGCGTKPYELLFNVDCYVGLEIPGGGHDDRAKSADIYYNGKNFPFKKSAFDYIILNEVLEHIFEPEELIGNVYSLLKPNGLLLITVPFVWDEHEKPYDYGRYTSFGLKYLISKKGFEIIDQRKSGNYVETLAQMFSSYMYTILCKGNKYISIIVSFFFCAPVLIFGIVLQKILPKNSNLYLDNIILARKSSYK
jgi:SAM-dependent methyltransferase